VLLAHERAAAPPALGLDHALLDEAGEGGPHGHPPGPQRRGEVALGREALAGQVLAGRDGGDQAVRDVVDAARRLDRCREGAAGRPGLPGGRGLAWRHASTLPSGVCYTHVKSSAKV
jgi:hypothetical protein